VAALFHAVVAQDWLSLAVVSAEVGERAWWLVQALEQIGAQGPRPLRTLNVLGVTAARAAAMAHALAPGKLRAAAPQRYLAATDSPVLNPASLEVVMACDAVLLLLEEGRTRIPAARRLVELIGRERLMGAVLGSW
jgi:hypothetical protein